MMAASTTLALAKVISTFTKLSGLYATYNTKEAFVWKLTRTANLLKLYIKVKIVYRR
jgi:hypothetical protein